MEEYIELNPSSGYQLTNYDIVEVKDNMCIIKNNNLYGLMRLNSKNLIGHVIVEPKYEKMKILSSHIIAFKDKTYGLMNNNGEIMKGTSFDEIEPFYNGVAIYRIGDDEGLIDESGLKLTLSKYNSLSKQGNFYYFSRGIFKGYLDRNGNELLVTIGTASIANNKFFSIREYKSKQTFTGVERSIKYGLYDLQGNKLLEPIYDFISVVDDEKVIVKKKKKIQLINLKTNKVINLKTNKVINLKKNYSKINHYRNNYAVFVVGNYMGLLNNNQEEVLKPEYSSIYHNNELVLTKGNDFDRVINLNLINDNNKGVVLSTTGEAKITDNGIIIVLMDGRYRLYDKMGRQLNEEYYYSVAEIGLYLRVGINKQYGLLDSTGKKIIDIKYPSLRYVKQIDNLIYVNYHDDGKDSLYGLYDLDGRELVKPIKAEKMFVLNNQMIIVDNYLYYLNGIKYLYHVKRNSYDCSFDSLESKEQFNSYYDNYLMEQIQTIKQEQNQKIAEINREANEKIKKLLYKEK